MELPLHNSLRVLLHTCHEEYLYVDEVLKRGGLTPDMLKRLTLKRDHLIAAGQWVEDQLNKLPTT